MSARQGLRTRQGSTQVVAPGAPPGQRQHRTPVSDAEQKGDGTYVLGVVTVSSRPDDLHQAASQRLMACITPDARERRRIPTMTTETQTRRCIGSSRFGIDAHDADAEGFPVQPSQNDSLGRMCKPHWRDYTNGLRKAAVARRRRRTRPRPSRPWSRCRRAGGRPGVGRRAGPGARDGPGSDRRARGVDASPDPSRQDFGRAGCYQVASALRHMTVPPSRATAQGANRPCGGRTIPVSMQPSTSVWPMISNPRLA